MKTNVKNYKTQQLLDKVAALESFKGFPLGYWILGVRSIEDAFNVYDDKFYIFKNKECLSVLTGTTNTGDYGLKNFEEYSKLGVAQIKADEWYYDVWTRGLHKGRMPALLQSKGFKVIRDNNKNDKSGDKQDWTWEYNKGLNFHTNNYDLKAKIISWFIGKWSVGCQVTNDVPLYSAFMKNSLPQNSFTYVLLNEF